MAHVAKIGGPAVVAGSPVEGVAMSTQGSSPMPALVGGNTICVEKPMVITARPTMLIFSEGLTAVAGRPGATAAIRISALGSLPV